MNGKSKMYVIDKDFRILYANDSFRQNYPDVEYGTYCYKFLGRMDDICPSCPVRCQSQDSIFYNKTVGEWVKAQVTEIEWDGNPSCYAIMFRNWRSDEMEDFPEHFDDDKMTDLEIKNKLLRRQNNLLNYINEEMPGGFHQCALKSGYPFIHISNQMLRMLDYTRDEIRINFENKFINLVHPDDRHKFSDASERVVIESETVKEIRCRLITRNGYIWTKNLTMLCEYEDEMFYQGTILDITDEIEAQTELEQRNREMEVILDSIPGGMKISRVDDMFSYQYISHEAASLLGYTVDELMEVSRGNSSELIYEPDRKYAIERIKESLEYKSSYNVRYRIVCKDGSLKYIMECGKKVINKDGEECINSLYLDVTREQETEELIKLQQELIISEQEQKKQQQTNMQQLELIQALSSDYNNIFYINIYDHTFEIYRQGGSIPDYIKQFLSENMHDYFICVKYYTEKCVYEPDKKSLIEFLEPENIMEKLKQREFITFNYRIFRDENTTYYQMKCVRVGDADSFTRIILGFRDIDEEIHKESEQKQILADALSQAEYANHAKTAFLNNMSHDIRTPMNAIIGFTALALTHIDHKERVHDYLEKIAQSSNHLLSLINDVLDMSRIESGKMRLEEKPENLAEIMRNMRNIIITNINSKQLDLYIDTIDVTDEDVYCDKLRLNQVLLNLISNAIKFTNPHGTISITIMQISNSKGYAEYEFRVKDTGIGMSKDFAEHIFEPFTRERTSTVSGIQGTGLGMSITKNIIDMMNGTITVNSEKGKGSEFIVRLRFKLQKSGNKANEVIEELKGVRSLVVDDDINSCRSVSKMLRRIGLRAEWTMYGREAVLRTIDAIEADDGYQVYIIDWLMPDMNGIETAREIRNVVGDDAPIIILSAGDWSDIEDEARKAGVTDFVSKPMFSSDLRRVLLKNCLDTVEDEPDEDFSSEMLNGKRVLFAEDNELNREIVHEMLDMSGIIVDEAENGQVALEMFEKSDIGYYDMILMDIQMPVMNGYDSAMAIRSLKREDAETVIICAMTANAFAEDIQEAKNAGMNDHIAKPLSPEKFMHVMEKWLS